MISPYKKIKNQRSQTMLKIPFILSFLIISSVFAGDMAQIWKERPESPRKQHLQEDFKEVYVDIRNVLQGNVQEDAQISQTSMKDFLERLSLGQTGDFFDFSAILDKKYLAETYSGKEYICTHTSQQKPSDLASYSFEFKMDLRDVGTDVTIMIYKLKAMSRSGMKKEFMVTVEEKGAEEPVATSSAASAKEQSLTPPVPMVQPRNTGRARSQSTGQILKPLNLSSVQIPTAESSAPNSARNPSSSTSSPRKTRKSKEASSSSRNASPVKKKKDSPSSPR